MAEKFNIEKLVSKVNDFILQNFVTVSEKKDFQNISMPGLVKYLSSDSLKTNINYEFAAFKAARNWIIANEPPSEAVDEIMSYVRFGLIEPNQLMEEILQDPVIQTSKTCQKMISDAMLYHTNLFTQPFYEGVLNKPRGKRGLMIIPGGTFGDGYDPTEDHVNVA